MVILGGKGNGMTREAGMALRARIDGARSEGECLDQEMQCRLEQYLQVDLSQVSIHTGPVARQLAEDLHADAFTCGTDLFFAASLYQPHTQSGRWLLTHEIVHVLQQAQSVVRQQGAAHEGLIGTRGDAWEKAADAIATHFITGSRPQASAWSDVPVAAASIIGRADGPLMLQCHDSFEHRALGDVPGKDIYSIAANGPNRTEILNREISLLWLWHQNPEQVTEAQINQLCPWIRTLRLNGSGLLVTYGELNALPDYIATPLSLDAIPQSMLLPILQYIRQEGYIQLNKLLGKTVTDPFQDSVFSPSQWYPDLVSKLLQTQALDTLTQGLGIKGVDHYQALLSRNACHFAPYSWYRWQSSYLIARDLAKRAYATSDPNERARYTYQAWMYHGYADHFLQDSFAAGHLVNKTLIMQWFIEWAATQPLGLVADWNFLKNVTAVSQPGLSGRALYDPNYAGLSNDPQTAEDQLTYAERLQTTNVIAKQDDLNTSYQNYLTFLSSVITQSSSAYIHDHYNANSLWVGSNAHPSAYEIWGDDTLFSGGNAGDGALFTSTTAQMSQQSILELLSGGQTAITPKQLRDYFPTTVRSTGNQMVSLEAWNDTQKAFCGANVFPKLHDIIVNVANPRIFDVSQDQDLGVRWSANLKSSGYNLTSVLNYNGRVFSGSQGYVYECNPFSGAVNKSLLVTGSVGVGDYETRLATNGQMLFVGVHGYVYGLSLNLSTWSSTAWSCSLPKAGYTVVDVLYENNRLFAASAGYVYELNPGNGQVIQQLLLVSSVGQGDYTSTMVTDGLSLFVGTHGYVYRVSLGNWSSAVWSASLPSAGYTLVDVLLKNGQLFAGSNGRVYELIASNGQIVHNLLLTDTIGVGDYTTRLASDGQQLFVGTHGYVYGVSLSNWSQAAWTADLAGNRYSNANVFSFGGQLVAGSYGSLYHLNPSNGQLLRSMLITSTVGAGNYETRLVSPDGEVFFVGTHGYAYGVSLTPAAGPRESGVINYPIQAGKPLESVWKSVPNPSGPVLSTGDDFMRFSVTNQPAANQALNVSASTILPTAQGSLLVFRIRANTIQGPEVKFSVSGGAILRFTNEGQVVKWQSYNPNSGQFIDLADSSVRADGAWHQIVLSLTEDALTLFEDGNYRFSWKHPLGTTVNPFFGLQLLQQGRSLSFDVGSIYALPPFLAATNGTAWDYTFPHSTPLPATQASTRSDGGIPVSYVSEVIRFAAQPLTRANSWTFLDIKNNGPVASVFQYLLRVNASGGSETKVTLPGDNILRLLNGGTVANWQRYTDGGPFTTLASSDILASNPAFSLVTLITTANKISLLENGIFKYERSYNAVNGWPSGIAVQHLDVSTNVSVDFSGIRTLPSTKP